MYFRIEVDNAEDAFPCRSDQPVLIGMTSACKCYIQVGCRSGGCGVCKVQVITGQFETATMSSAHVSAEDRRSGIVLACKLYPRSDLAIRPLRRPAARKTSSDNAQTVDKEWQLLVRAA